jgi:hypothetical protein
MCRIFNSVEAGNSKVDKPVEAVLKIMASFLLDSLGPEIRGYYSNGDEYKENMLFGKDIATKYIPNPC